jgi:Ran GTPase-activating protein (RanGAP) involved in mRNA processing and transport
MSQNVLGLQGLHIFLEQGIKFNKSIKYLDLFDVKFGNDGFSFLENALKTNDTLKSLRICNTSATANVVSYFSRFIRS